MDIFLRTRFGGYLASNPNVLVAPVVPVGPQPISLCRLTLRSVIIVGPNVVEQDPARPVRGGDLVTIQERRTTAYYSFEEAPAPGTLPRVISGNAVTPRLSLDVFQIRREDGSSEPIGHRDRVAFGLTRNLVDQIWMFLPDVNSAAVIWNQVRAPGDENMFEIVVPASLSDFTLPPSVTVPYQAADAAERTLKSEVQVAGGPGVTAPGGMRVELFGSDASLALSSAATLRIVPEHRSSASVDIGLVEHFGAFAPGDSRIATVRAFDEASGSERTATTTLQFGRIPFMGMRIENIRETGCAPLAGRLRNYLPWPRYYSVHAAVFLKPWLKPDDLPLQVTLSTDEPRLNLMVAGEQPTDLSIDRPVSFWFSPEVPRNEAGELSTAIRVEFNLRGRRHRPSFAVRVSQSGVVFDPQ